MSRTFLSSISDRSVVADDSKTTQSSSTSFRQTAKVKRSTTFFLLLLWEKKGRFRRFSSAFLQSERKKLAKERTLLRIVREEKSTRYGSERIFLHHLPSTIVAPLKSGQRVLGELSTGRATTTTTKKKQTFSVRIFRSADVSLHRATFLSHVENAKGKYRIQCDDASLGQIDVNETDVMVREDEP